MEQIGGGGLGGIGRGNGFCGSGTLGHHYMKRKLPTSGRVA